MGNRAVDPQVAADLAKQWDEYFGRLEAAGAPPLDLASLAGPGSSLTVGEEVIPLEFLVPARSPATSDGTTGTSQ